MTAFSLGTTWEETIAFLRRESGLLIPVALAIFGPAQILAELGMNAVAATRTGAPGGTTGMGALLTIPAALLVLFGNLAVTMIVLTPGISVGEALSSALRRLPRTIGTLLLVALGASMAALAIIIAATLGAMTFRVDPRSPTIASQIVVLVCIPMLVLGIRLLVLLPVIAIETLAPVETIRRAWALGRGNIARFAAVWLLAMFLGIIVTLIDQFVIGSIIQLFKLVVSDVELLTIVQMLISAALDSMLSLGMAVYIALVYRNITAGPAA